MFVPTKYAAIALSRNPIWRMFGGLDIGVEELVQNRNESRPACRPYRAARYRGVVSRGLHPGLSPCAPSASGQLGRRVAEFEAYGRFALFDGDADLIAPEPGERATGQDGIGGFAEIGEADLFFTHAAVQ